MKKIYDGFTFFNELDLLELRLDELYDHVDYFILVESDHTFTNIPKPYYFEENKERYSKFLEKIRYIKHTSTQNEDPWQNETEQRNAIKEGYYDAEPDDIIIVSDLDEIIRPSIVDSLRELNDDIYAFRMPLFYYMFNWMDVGKDKNTVWSMATKFPIIDDLSPQNIRDLRFQFFEGRPCSYKIAKCNVVDHSGWHFSYMGNVDFIKRKMLSFSHASEVNHDFYRKFTSLDDFRICHIIGTSFTAVIVDDYFPKSIINSITKYKKHILNNAKYTVEAFLDFKRKIHMKKYHIHENYIHRETVEHFDDTPLKDEWQKEVYEYAKNVAVEQNCSFVVDYGCGSGYKLLKYFNDYKTVGIDVESTVQFLRKTYPDKDWDTAASPYRGVDLFIAADVIEHLINPDALLEYIKLCSPREIIFSTPDRHLANKNWAYNENGPTSNASHAREWNFEEFESYIAESFDIVSHIITNELQCTQLIHCRMKT